MSLMSKIMTNVFAQSLMKNLKIYWPILIQAYTKK